QRTRRLRGRRRAGYRGHRDRWIRDCAAHRAVCGEGARVSGLTTTHRALAAVAVLLAVSAAFVGTSRRTTAGRVDVASLAKQIEHEDDHVTAIELAQWIKDRKPGLRVLDIRADSEF